MSLHTDTVDGHALVLHLLHHIIDTVALVGVYRAVVVIEQQGIGVGLAGKLESFLNELVAAELIHSTLAIRVGSVGIVLDSLVHHVPTVDDVLIAGNDGLDVLLHTLVEHLLRGVVAKHPAAYLRMPHQAVATQFDTILAGEVGNAVSILPVKLSFPWFGRFWFHVVLSRDRVELLSDEILLLCVRHITLVDGDANHEVVLVGVF